ncbi:MAG: CHAT domain-containing tetratricopeptide repeat protein [Acidobacteriaceae bacterium]
MPAHSESSTTFPEQIAALRHDLTLPAARDQETRLRILTMLGMLEVNYDAGMARETWKQVEKLALHRHHYLLATRAIGEQGIAAFLLGDIATAKKDVLKAWMIAKIDDPAAHIRYASMYGTGLVALGKYKEALGPLNEAIRVAGKTPGVAYPTIAITAKIQALSGLGLYEAALALAASEMKRVSDYHLAGHLYDLHRVRAGVYERMGDWNQAISDYQEAIQYATQLSYWRGISESGGLLAKAYLHQGALQPALTTINDAIDADKQIPDELYFVPRNLGIKAEILARMGKLKESNDLYAKSADLLDALLSRVPTPMVERQLLNELSIVYAGYFASLTRQGRLADAFQIVERARGRIEAQLLTHHEVIVPHQPSPAELHLAKLNLELLDTDGAAARGGILSTIYTTEQEIGDNSPADFTPPTPVPLEKLQGDLSPSELFIEYVLANPQSYALVVTRHTLHCYTLPARTVLNQEASQYRSELIQKKRDPALAQHLFNDLLGPIPEYKDKPNLIVVPDGELNLIPFAALMNSREYVLTTHLVSVVPSGTVLDMLRHLEQEVNPRHEIAYLGVAAWTSRAPPETLLAVIRRAVSKLERSELVPLPTSKYEVETIADDLPQPDTILLGSDATETEFTQLPLSRYNVIHLALHGYVDPEFPDRSALVFAPNPPVNDGFLQVRDIRRLPLHADLVTLSACDTGVGPVGEDGVADIVNAFLEAGAQSVVFTLWEVQDQATTNLMVDFYRHLSDHEARAEALRQAQIQMLKSGAPPYFWAGFELDGEPNGDVLRNTATAIALRRNR